VKRATTILGTVSIAAILAATSAIAAPDQAGAPTQVTVAPRAAAAEDTLLAGFREPPATARPRVWWHWMNGNITERGIDEDLAWMKRIGIAGVQTFDGSLNTPVLVDKRLSYMSQGWQDAFRHAVDTAQKDGLEFTIASSGGWSETGGPWVRPEQAMKKMVWSEVVVGAGRVAAALPTPPSVAGPFQAVAGGGSEPSEETHTTLPALYRDTAVVAYRILDSEREGEATITASSAIDPKLLSDGDLAGGVTLPFAGRDTVWVQFSYARPQTIRALELAVQLGRKVGPLLPPLPIGRIEASDDGVTFRTISGLPPRGNIRQTIAFPATRAKHFRLVLEPRFGSISASAFDDPQPAPASLAIAEMRFLGAPRVNRFEDKAGWVPASELGASPTPDLAASETIRPADVVDLTGRLRADGTLDWVAPRGQWRIVRMGWSLTGKMNNPASPEGTGLEVDKLNARHVTNYAEHYLGLYEKAVGADRMGRTGIAAMLNDSYEALSANWTDDILDQFRARRGYDPRPFLPVLVGRPVESATRSDQFLWDFRRTLSDLIAEAHYGTLTTLLHQRGMIRYGESHETARAFVGDGMEVKKTADVPMGATWASQSGPVRPIIPDILESASVAHIYGQNLVAAESFTGVMPAYGFTPESLKPVADRMMANGLNRFVVHTSVHQPLDRVGPGIGLGPFGQWFTRNETWAEMAKPWVNYLARSSQMLQQGRFVADVAWFYGEDDNITAAFDRRIPAVPDGYRYDFINADAIKSVLSVADGNLITPGGASYRVLAIDPAVRTITVGVLRKLNALVGEGATLVGARPLASPSGTDDPAEFRRLVDRIWSAPSVHADLGRALAARAVSPDLQLEPALRDLRFVHRALPDGDLYYLWNPGDSAVAGQVSFRTAGRSPELWRADDASVEPLSYAVRNGRTAVPLRLLPHETAFVVFRTPTDAPMRTVPAPTPTNVQSLTTGWTLSLSIAGSKSVTMPVPTLASWADSTDPKLRYFSGIGTYRTTLRLPRDWKARGTRWFIDLGSVKNLAEVRLNGCVAGVAWKAPFRVDIGRCARAGANALEVRVANLWPNRLIGDKQPGFNGTPAFATFNPYRAESPLLPSGLLGPVTVSSQ